MASMLCHRLVTFPLKISELSVDFLMKINFILLFLKLCMIIFVMVFQDISMTMLKKVLRQVEIIKSSRSGIPNFESLEVEVNDLQNAVAQYLQSRGAKVFLLAVIISLFVLNERNSNIL